MCSRNYRRGETSKRRRASNGLGIILENKLTSGQNHRWQKKKRLFFPRILHFLLGHSPCESNEPRSLELASSTMMKLSLAKSVLSENSPSQQTTMRDATIQRPLACLAFLSSLQREVRVFHTSKERKGGNRMDYSKRARDVAQSQDLLSKLSDS